MKAKGKTIFATGADIKNGFLFARGEELYSGSDIGDLGDAVNYERFRKEAALMAKKLKIKPEVVACDPHPGYFSTKFAKDAQPWFKKEHKLVQVQHHHAHIASVMHEYDLKGPVIGVSFDGTGYGTDGNVWGGEFLLVKDSGFERVAHLKYWTMPGGDKAISQPWRMVLSILGEEAFYSMKDVPKEDRELVVTMMERNLNSPLTSSAGRLFDAAAALLGICRYASYEAEGPIKLEAMCDKNTEESYGFETQKHNDCYVIDTKGLFQGMAGDMKEKTHKGVIAAKFHNSMAEVICRTVKKLSKRFGVNDVALSGGVFQNNFLRKKVLEKLDSWHFNVYINGSIPVNDLNIALGQYYVSSSSRKD